MPVSYTHLPAKVGELLETIQHDMFERAKAHRDAHTYDAHSLEEMKDIADNKPGFIRAMWCGCQECEDKLKEEVGVTSRCMPFKQEKLADTCVYCGKPVSYTHLDVYKRQVFSLYGKKRLLRISDCDHGDIIAAFPKRHFVEPFFIGEAGQCEPLVPVSYTHLDVYKRQVFAGGDCASGPASVIKAIAAAKVVAANIDEYLGFRNGRDDRGRCG